MDFFSMIVFDKITLKDLGLNIPQLYKMKIPLEIIKKFEKNPKTKIGDHKDFSAIINSMNSQKSLPFII